MATFYSSDIQTGTYVRARIVVEEITIDKIGNYTDVDVYVQMWRTNTGYTTNGSGTLRIGIDGLGYEESKITLSQEITHNSYTVIGSKRRARITHDADGRKTLKVYASAKTGTDNVNFDEQSFTATLTAIDRSAPSVLLSISDITISSMRITASASAACDTWQYSTNNGGSWTTFSTASGTSASTTLSSLSPNTSYTVKVRARKKANQVYGTSSASNVKTLGGSVINSVSAVTADASTVSISINVTVYQASYTHSLAIKNGSTTYLTISGLSWSTGTSTKTITLTAAQRTTLLTAMKSIKSFMGTFALTTTSGSTQIGTVSSKTATVQTTSANSSPTISGFTYADVNTTTAGITGNDQYFIQGYSRLQVTPGTATAKNGASISNYTATCNGVSVSNTTGSALTVGKISKSGSVTVTLTVTDSRGYTASYSKTVTVIAYSSPKVSSLTLRRTNDIEAEMQLIFNGSISAISVGGVTKNALQYVQYQYKLTSASSYGSYVSILSSVTKNGTSFSYSNLQLISLNAASSYDFHLQIQDKLGSSSSVDLYYTVPQGTPLLALRKKMIGINNASPAAALDVSGIVRISNSPVALDLIGDLRINSSTVADYVIQRGSSGIWTYRKWKSGVAECWGQYSFTTTCQSAWGVLYESDPVSPPSFPFTFASAPQVFINPANGTYALFIEMGPSNEGPTTTSPGKFYAVRPKSQSSGSYKVSIYVIGKV